MEKSKNKIAYYLGGGFIASLLLGGLYVLWNRLNAITLSDWLEDYFKEIKEKLKNNKEKEIPPEIIGNIYHLISELEDYLYLVENYDFEEARIAAYNTDIYKMQFEEMLHLRMNCNKKAVSIAEKRLKFDLHELDDMIKNYDLRNVKELMKNSKKSYDKLPDIPSDDVRRAFILYSKKLKENKLLEDEQTYLNQVTGNSDFGSILTTNIYVNNFKIRDEIKAKFNIDYKYLEPLLHKYNLLKDNEVKYYFEEKNKMESLSNMYIS